MRTRLLYEIGNERAGIASEGYGNLRITVNFPKTLGREIGYDSVYKILAFDFLLKYWTASMENSWVENIYSMW